MKKRLLITSIVMMLVVAVALSTATYAWFTSATNVTASTVTMTAGTSASSALGISWFAGSSNSDYGTTITAVAPALTTEQTNGFQPAAPNALGDAQPNFYTAYIDSQGAFTSAGSATDVYRFANYKDAAAAAAVQPTPDTYSNIIHVSNLAASGSVAVTLTANITVPEGGTDGTALVRIAVFELTTTSTSYDTYTYKGCISKIAGTDNTAVGAIQNGATASDLLTGHNTTASIALGPITAQQEKAYAVYVWLDGALFDEAQGGKAANIALSFATPQNA